MKGLLRHELAKARPRAEIEAEREAEKQAASKKEFERRTRIGSVIPAFAPDTPVSIELAPWQACDRAGNAIGTFNVYVAPQDLVIAAEPPAPSATAQKRIKVLERFGKLSVAITGQAPARRPVKANVFTFDEACAHIAAFDNWGSKGLALNNEAELYQGLRDGSAHNKWVLPPIEILSGYLNGKIVYPDSMAEHRNTGFFSGTYKTDVSSVWIFSHWYLSCTRFAADSSQKCIARFSDDRGISVNRSSGDKPFRVSVRLVRFCPVP